MSAKTVTIDHPHAEVIAAYYSGKTVQIRREGVWLDYTMGRHLGGLSFNPTDEYRLKQKPRKFYALPTCMVDVGSESPVEVVRLYEYLSDALADKSQYNLAGEIIHLREVMPE